MALTDNINHKVTGALPVGNRNDSCYLCMKKISAKDSVDYRKRMEAIKGKVEGKPVVKIGRPGTEFVICLECIHELANENPLETESK